MDVARGGEWMITETQQVLLGDEAVALGAVHAGITAAYAYPGTPSTEIVEYLIGYEKRHGSPRAAWCANEKTAYEGAMGVSFAGKRALVAMKHVGLNVAADPFVNSAIVAINGGLVVAVADDPGMHSSQNEQDTRYLVDFARVICLEPANQQEAYGMTREAFDLSEKFQIPVVVRLVTRLAHSRGAVALGGQREQNPLAKVSDPRSWILLPVNARRQWHELLQRQKEIEAYTESCPHNTLFLSDERRGLGVITTGVARNYYLENVDGLKRVPSHLHVGAYPLPLAKIRELVGHVERVLVLEEGYPFLERQLRGITQSPVEIMGKMSGHVTPEGELDPDIVRAALKLAPRRGTELSGITLPKRPPQLCSGCPHADAYNAIKDALSEYEQTVVTSDIGCYTLGALPPYSAIETCVCMGASIGIARGAAAAGLRPALAVIGDSTFLHSGVTPLMDCAAENADMTLIILDNEAVAMTGGQQPLLPSRKLRDICLGVGVDPTHMHVVEVHPRKKDELVQVLKREMDYRGFSVVIAHRTCLEMAKKMKKDAR
jgi:indolepyruvate ferredoxin oxidoreductase alpha subunit